MDKKIELQLIETIRKRMVRTKSFYKFFEDTIFFDMGVQEEDGHLRGISLGPSPVDMDEILDYALDYWKKDSRKKFRIRLPKEREEEVKDALIQRGFYCEDEKGGPGMERRGKILRDVKNRVIFPEIDEKVLEDAASVIGSAFELSRKTCLRMLKGIQKGELAMIYKNKKPISCGLLSVDESTKYWGLYYIATDAKERGKGFGKDLVTEMTNYAYDHGAKNVILQASELGFYVYDALGYKVKLHYINYYLEKEN